ncbi:MAG: tRNA(5-methylaminomethyl-2-thiouridylate) methyltransferase, partial [Desulfovibrio sp.]|nr:tRNA(5-methylaminomethyl-2-thiouridylate) methyltransferase [Desulfovibrio sp.]
MTQTPDAVVLFSGGLDSLLAARVLMAQGLRVRCLHCVSPFFGEPGAIGRWRHLYGVDVDVADVSGDFAALLRERPAHGFGKALNPCVDCKILLLRAARRHMEAVGASFLASGEVLGQRPMSQRLDTLHRKPRPARGGGGG